MSEVSVFSDHVCELGEGPSYDPATDALYWFDIVNCRLLEKSVAGGALKIHELGQMASAIAIIDDKRQLIATETGLFVRDVATGRMTLHTPVEADNPLTRSNDSRVHPCGALWMGTMGKSEAKGAGSIYWFFKGELRKLFSGITVSNSICFSGDGALAYYTDTSTGLLMRVACNPATGLPAGEPNVFVDHRSSKGYVDGSVVDHDGVLWNAVWGGKAVKAYSPDGTLLREIAMPVTQPSCPAFAGAKADRLAVTSAWKGKDEKQRQLDPQAGMTFVLDIKVNGRFEPRVLIA
ncbi:MULTISPECIES: SMP-30/gluconolactonase/LRE family protein [unclassified Mesorhizobium]|uniref:SMP-30/gluconolactonase/LRE family protein n=1 Tax=unclassified Mesorhizobium TaxID=325217 RepID=UPI000FCA593E|nr:MULTISPECIES: SMP-30/gluconolactonase/LRE family protein [unclassified Mesorhizobium]TGR42787.1 SMP-30/gluconolactonase/LRE family protein [bacterium M00.F.Ca.ET.199.01.1.1]TGU30042.1 SMP-30/gluconolactonase/LRE family protein [bacterium M00.F.Ca.ET.156.01.1.1]TGV84770.1 SMP-30/gluconolactonase/LRE family protein [Mesorhizobium sp. M00.F.Ca.ET.149.01.1.1]TIS86206.1 MAG: SMP-30/gluconolactonase/LRE family protein [Mesorhizobium sp.]RUW52962.1 SMP-30/gluconolactonase/LRE family protein [Mesor